MSAKPDDGGPAFPVPPKRVNIVAFKAQWTYPDHGMTLRDYFAAASLQGMIACEQVQHDTFQDYARIAYQQADAMLAERARKEAQQ